MARPLDLDELLQHFTLAADELELLRNKTGPTRLGFSLLLKYLAWKGRFPRGRGELPDNTVDHVARQVGVPPEELGLYDWSGRQSKRHRVEVRQHLGFRECSVTDTDKLTAWLAEHVAQRERRPERVREELLAHCHTERIELFRKRWTGSPAPSLCEPAKAPALLPARLHTGARPLDRAVTCVPTVRSGWIYKPTSSAQAATSDPV